VPRIKEQNRHDQVQSIGRRHAHAQMCEESIREQCANGKLCFLCNLCLDRNDGDEDCRKHKVAHDDYPEVYHAHVQFVRSLWTVTKSEDEA